MGEELIPQRLPLYRGNIPKLREECVDLSKDYSKNTVAIAAQTLALCRDGELFFIGRSAESVYDFLWGALDRLTWQSRLHLVVISTRNYEGYPALTAQQKKGIQTYLTHLGLHPKQIIQRKRRTCLVDFVYSGWTIDAFLLLMQEWTKECRLSLADMQSKIECILFQQEGENREDLCNADFVNYYGWGRRSLHLVTVPHNFWYDATENVKKTLDSYTINDWGDAEGIRMLHPDNNSGDRNMLFFREYGQSYKGKAELRKAMILQKRAMSYRWFYTILSGLNRTPVKNHDNVHLVNLKNRRRKKRDERGTKATWQFHRLFPD